MIVVELRGSHWVCNHTSDKLEALFLLKLEIELDDTKFCYQSITAILTKYVIIKIDRNFLFFVGSGRVPHMARIVLFHCPINAGVRTADSQSDNSFRV